MRATRAERAIPVSEYLELEKQKVLEGDLSKETRRMYNESLELSVGWREWFLSFWGLPGDFHFSEGGE